jgi:hypothetical protein
MASAGQCDVSDWNNALKLGFDPATEAYPDWLSSQVGGQLQTTHTAAGSGSTIAGRTKPAYLPIPSSSSSSSAAAAAAAGITL